MRSRVCPFCRRGRVGGVWGAQVKRGFGIWDIRYREAGKPDYTNHQERALATLGMTTRGAAKDHRADAISLQKTDVPPASKTKNPRPVGTDAGRQVRE